MLVHDDTGSQVEVPRRVPELWALGIDEVTSASPRESGIHILG